MTAGGSGPAFGLSVRELVRRTCRRGDLHHRLARRATAEEGNTCQRYWQSRELSGYQTEVALSRSFLVAGIRLTLRGRADGLRLQYRPNRSAGTVSAPALAPTGAPALAPTGAPALAPAGALLDEFKATRSDPREMHAQFGHEHLAQVSFYAGLLALDAPAERHFHLRVRYVHPDTLTQWCYEETATRSQVLLFLTTRVEQYARRMARECRRRQHRDAALHALPFPLAGYRPNQRALAGRVYQTLLARQSLLLEASTGIGKSLGVLYPALRVFGRNSVQRYFYLTARRTGAQAAVRALAQLQTGRQPLIWVELTAKAQVCRIEGAACDPPTCPNAVGYYDRVEPALQALLPLRTLSPERIAEVARRFRVCPFELSLDAAEWADVVIADYNYIFDPDVQLRRFADGRDIALLIDEAHQLAPRAVAMLSAQLSTRTLRAASAAVPAGPLHSQLGAVERALERVLATLDPDAGDRSPSPEVRGLTRTLEQLLDLASVLDWTHEVSDALADWLLAVHRWLRRLTLTDAMPRLFHLRQVSAAAAAERTLMLTCLDPAMHLATTLARYASDVRFSATLRPTALYQQQHGRPDAAATRIASPYRADQLSVLIVPDIATYWRQRQQSLPALVALLRGLSARCPGRYLIALPSFEYLQALAAALATSAPLPALVLVQQRHMSPADRTALLESLAGASAGAMLLVVLGGMFAESVDYTGIGLSGILCVSVGLAPASVVTAQLQRHYDQRSGAGELVARQQPAMVKVVQMAGRLLRDPDDRGLLCLIDERFRQPGFAQFFPDHWQPQVCRGDLVASEAARFFGAGAAKASTLRPVSKWAKLRATRSG